MTQITRRTPFRQTRFALAVVSSAILATSALCWPTAATAASPASDGHSHHSHDGHHKHDHDTHHKHDHDGHREHGVHVHGEGRLTLAVTDSTLEVALTLPADSAFGFEHKPTNDAESVAVSKALNQLGNAADWLDGVKECSVTRSSLPDPFATATKSKDEGHRDLEGSWTLDCKAAPVSLDVRLFSLLPRLKKLDVEWMTDKGAGAIEMSPDNTRLSLP